jgi:hypothetical protein
MRIQIDYGAERFRVGFFARMIEAVAGSWCVLFGIVRSDPNGLVGAMIFLGYIRSPFIQAEMKKFP